MDDDIAELERLLVSSGSLLGFPTDMLLLHVLRNRLARTLLIVLQIIVVLNADPAVAVLLALLAGEAAVSSSHNPLVLLVKHIRLQARSCTPDKASCRSCCFSLPLSAYRGCCA